MKDEIQKNINLKSFPKQKIAIKIMRINFDRKKKHEDDEIVKKNQFKKLSQIKKQQSKEWELKLKG